MEISLSSTKVNLSCDSPVVKPVAIRRVRPLPTIFCRREFQFPTLAPVSGAWFIN